MGSTINIIYIFILLGNLTFGQTTKWTKSDIEKYTQSIEELRTENKLVKISYPNMSACGDGIDGYFLNNELVYIDSRYNAELGFSSKKYYLKEDKFLKIEYREHFAEWEKHRNEYFLKDSTEDFSKMTYSDTVYSIRLAKRTVFHQKSGGEIISDKIDKPLIDKLLSCGIEIQNELQIVIYQVDSLKLIKEMPYMCHDNYKQNEKNKLSIACGDKLYWNVVELNKNVIELLIDQLDDTTTTESIVPNFGYHYTTADIAYTALNEIIHNMPTFEFLGVEFDKEGCGYCSYWQHLNKTIENRKQFKEAVRQWYIQHKDDLVWVKSNIFETCDCAGEHPNGGHYELNMKKKQLILKGKIVSKKSSTDEKIEFFVQNEALPLHEILKEFHGEYIHLEINFFESQDELDQMPLESNVFSESIKGKFGINNHFGDNKLPLITRFTLKQNLTSESLEIESESLEEFHYDWGYNLSKNVNKFISLTITVLDYQPVYDLYSKEIKNNLNK